MTTGGTKEEYVVDVWSGKSFCTDCTICTNLTHFLLGHSDCDERGLLLSMNVGWTVIFFLISQ